MPLSRKQRELQEIKDKVIFILRKEYELDYNEIGYIFDMTKQGVWKAKKRHEDKRLESIS